MENETHQHKFDGEPVIYPIKKVRNEYQGVVGDMAFATRACTCGKIEPIDYGKTKEMREKYDSSTD